MMTPQEVANCTFTKAVMGGYNMASVDDFLDKLTEDYAELYKQNASLKKEMEVLVAKLQEYREQEDTIRSTLLAAQKMATSMVSEAESKRDALIADTAGAAKLRLQEIQMEVAQEEQRLVKVRQEVDQQILAEQQRLTIAQEELRSFIQTVQSVCQSQLTLLERLPQLPAAPAYVAPAAEAPAEEPEEKPAPSPMDAGVERNIQSVFDSFRSDSFPEDEDDDPFAEAAPAPAADPDDDESSTRVINLNDLQFGRNYNHD